MWGQGQEAGRDRTSPSASGKLTTASMEMKQQGEVAAAVEGVFKEGFSEEMTVQLGQNDR